MNRNPTPEDLALVAALTAEERALCTQLAVDPAVYAKFKKDRRASVDLAASLTPDEREVCAQLGVAPADYAAHKRAKLSQASTAPTAPAPTAAAAKALRSSSTKPGGTPHRAALLVARPWARDEGL